MQIFEELKARGLIAQLTDEEEIRELINAGKATFYIGFDATADSLHIRHFMALNLMRRPQRAGNRPIPLPRGRPAPGRGAPAARARGHPRRRQPYPDFHPPCPLPCTFAFLLYH